MKEAPGRIRAGGLFSGGDSDMVPMDMRSSESHTLFRPANGPGKFPARLLSALEGLCTRLHPATSGCHGCPDFPVSLESRVFQAIEPEMDIDVVYTWVDGTDPAHAAKRAQFLEKQKGVHENALDSARFRDNDELRFSLRALEQYAPWVRKVILATDGQCPKWIRRDHPKLRIVDHAAFIPERCLPTFNSHVIEAYLHEIPDLSEYYIYLNDDVFLGRPCRKTDFFTPNALPLAFVDWRLRRRFGYGYTKTPHAMSYFNTLRVLKERGVATNPKFVTAHGPYAQTKTNARDAFAFYRESIEAFATNRFRTAHELAMYCHALPLWAYQAKRIVPCDDRYYYVQTMRIDRIAYYTGLLNSRKDQAPPVFFCINDVGRDKDNGTWRDDLTRLLTAWYPHPSSFEASPPEAAP